jgi:hypothetical protein
LISQLLAKDEHGEHRDLYGSDRRSVIPYVYGRIGVAVCCSSVCLDLNGLADSSACVTFYSSRPRQVQCGLGPDRWPQGHWFPAY